MRSWRSVNLISRNIRGVREVIQFQFLGRSVLRPFYIPSWLMMFGTSVFCRGDSVLRPAKTWFFTQSEHEPPILF